MNKPLPIVIPSFGRSDAMTAHKIVANPIICVPESEFQEYKRINPELEYLIHPDSLVGLPAKRQFIIDKFDSVFMLADDCNKLNFLHDLPGKRTKFTAEDFYNLIQSTAASAADIDAAMFGFNHVKGFSTFGNFVGRTHRYSGFISGDAMGILNAKKNGLFFDTDYVCNDEYFITCLNASINRHILKDMRWALSTKKIAKGGNIKIRTNKSEKQDFEKLIRDFGNKVIKPKITNSLSSGNNKNLRTIEEIVEGVTTNKGKKTNRRKKSTPKVKIGKTVVFPF